MSQDRDLRALLAKIAASAGDPPEHGLDWVVSRRRRRTRRRRGAVATAAALAALTIGALPWLTRQQNDHDVSAERRGEFGPHPAELPDVVELHCTPQGTHIPVASIKPQGDGLHIDVHNSLGKSTDVWVRSEDVDWDSGRISVLPGSSVVRQQVPPGALTIGCDINGDEDSLQVQLVHVDDSFEEPQLACEDKVVLDPALLKEPTNNPSAAAQAFLDEAQAGPLGTDTTEPSTGYPTKLYDKTIRDQTIKVRVQVTREREILAIVRLYARAAGDVIPPAPEWTEAEGEYCPRIKDANSTTGPGPHDPPSD